MAEQYTVLKSWKYIGRNGTRRAECWSYHAGNWRSQIGEQQAFPT
jgi:hypothetical protein